MHSSGTSSSQFAEDVFQSLKSPTAVALSLDIVVFEDGTVVGQDESNTLSLLKNWVMARDYVIDAVGTRLASGHTREMINKFLKDIVETPPDIGLTVTKRGNDPFLEHAMRLQNALAAGKLESEVKRMASEPRQNFLTP